jgi:hypothetical protein
VVFVFVRPVFQSFLIAVFLHLAGGWKTLEGLLPGKNRRRAAAGPERKIRRCHSLYHMKITVNLADLTSEQVKFLSQLG